MSSLQNKQILLGISGGIAAYKAPDLVRRLRDLGANVRVVMTEAAKQFIGPLSLQAVSGHRVHSAMLDEEAEAAMGHIELARWADAIVIAPATADTLASLAHGTADDLLTTLVRAAVAPVLLAPAMNQAMWSDALTQRNVQCLDDAGYGFIGPDSGSQACGDVGAGRMSEPLIIAEAVGALFESGSLQGQHVVITAGPTREAIDPVRYISNYSSGKMGFALAQAAIEAGAKVTLIAGPVALDTPDRAHRIDVECADQMLAAVSDAVTKDSIFIATAAVADFKSKVVASNKLKKSSDQDDMTLQLVKNPDILHQVATMSERPQCVVGFAAESENLIENAQKKLSRKKLDLIVANDISRSDIGFGADSNEVTTIDAKTGAKTSWGMLSKAQLARKIVAQIAEIIS